MAWGRTPQGFSRGEDGSKGVRLFNRGQDEATATTKWADLGPSGQATVRDLWRQKDLGQFSGQFAASVPRHGVVLMKITPFKYLPGAFTEHGALTNASPLHE
jgi:alpha-galactosidase